MRATALESEATHHSLIPSDRVEGTAVRRSNGEKVGEIKRVMIDKVSGKVAYAVMRFGGFLGMGEKYHPLPWTRSATTQRWRPTSSIFPTSNCATLRPTGPPASSTGATASGNGGCTNTTRSRPTGACDGFKAPFATIGVLVMPRHRRSLWGAKCASVRRAGAPFQFLYPDPSNWSGWGQHGFKNPAVCLQAAGKFARAMHDPEKPGPDLIRPGYRFSEKHALRRDRRDHARGLSSAGQP